MALTQVGGGAGELWLDEDAAALARIRTSPERAATLVGRYFDLEPPLGRERWEDRDLVADVPDVAQDVRSEQHGGAGRRDLADQLGRPDPGLARQRSQRQALGFDRVGGDQVELRPVAGGEQEFSDRRFRWMIANRGVDIVQPDLHYYGGMIRSLRVARMADVAGMPTTVHISGGFGFVYMLHFASVVKDPGRYQELCFLYQYESRQLSFESGC